MYLCIHITSYICSLCFIDSTSLMSTGFIHTFLSGLTIPCHHFCLDDAQTPNWPPCSTPAPGNHPEAKGIFLRCTANIVTCVLTTLQWLWPAKQIQTLQQSPRKLCLSSHQPFQSSLTGLVMVHQRVHPPHPDHVPCSLCLQLSFPLLSHFPPTLTHDKDDQPASVCTQSPAQESL